MKQLSPKRIALDNLIAELSKPIQYKDRKTKEIKTFIQAKFLMPSLWKTGLRVSPFVKLYILYNFSPKPVYTFNKVYVSLDQFSKDQSLCDDGKVYMKFVKIDKYMKIKSFGKPNSIMYTTNPWKIKNVLHHIPDGTTIRVIYRDKETNSYKLGTVSRSLLKFIAERDHRINWQTAEGIVSGYQIVNKHGGPPITKTDKPYYNHKCEFVNVYQEDDELLEAIREYEAEENAQLEILHVSVETLDRLIDEDDTIEEDML
jgi:effector-binding domain-containing protein